MIRPGYSVVIVCRWVSYQVFFVLCVFFTMLSVFCRRDKNLPLLYHEIRTWGMYIMGEVLSINQLFWFSSKVRILLASIPVILIFSPAPLTPWNREGMTGMLPLIHFHICREYGILLSVDLDNFQSTWFYSCRTLRNQVLHHVNPSQ